MHWNFWPRLLKLSRMILNINLIVLFQLTVQIASLPGYMRFRTIPICVEAIYYSSESCEFRFGIGISNQVV